MRAGYGGWQPSELKLARPHSSRKLMQENLAVSGDLSTKNPTTVCKVAVCMPSYDTHCHVRLPIPHSH
eukprot:3862059-Amphidinium_carterae.2